MPFFSVIISTRNRPALFRLALESVLSQTWSDFDIIVVNDGSTIEYQPEYQSIIGRVDSNRVRNVTLVHRPRGHGGSYVRNFGASMATAPYLCFLDDDDCWIDPDHLCRARAVISGSAARVDLYMTNQEAFLNNERQPGPIWIENLSTILASGDNSPDSYGTYTVTVSELLRSHGFCHLNTLIVRRALYEEIGGMEETIRWEEDRDLYLRLIDRATTMKYSPITVARHNIPDPTKMASATTALSDLERRLFQLRVLDRSINLAQQPTIRAYASRHKAYALKRIAESLAASGRHAEAALYAREALSIGPTVRWAAYAGWLTLRALVHRS